MNVQLSRPEVELIEQALKLWTEEPHHRMLSASMMGAMLRGVTGQSKEELQSDMMKDQAQARAEAALRERQSLLLRAKLLQAQARESEHDITEAQPQVSPDITR